MIDFHEVAKSYSVKGKRRNILRNLTLALPRDKNIGVVGRNGAGKSTLLQLMSGTLRPDLGVIRKHGRISWPIGFSGGFHPALTGRQNARFIARVYGADTQSMVDYVEEFSELSDFLDMPLKTYSSGMRARLAFGVSMAAQFDCYLVDEITAVGDLKFREKCRRAFQEKLSSSQIVMVSHQESTLREFCECGLLLEDGVATFFSQIDDALKSYRALVNT